MRTERLALQARYSTAEATIRVTEHVTGLSQEMSDVARLTEGAREKSLGVQARAAALADIAGTAGGTRHAEFCRNREPARGAQARSLPESRDPEAS